ncbi:CheR family methyltransferase [Emticicia sp. C21]|uniref:CheR family methyltransferase n=1 Tax=Emticicia sp. C21 TaxID=2302915 RepID=UPI000E340C31|nr:CheR family methyltransferase [Emticicia sp. C21]RFS17280.1 GAF domain-containing protein [Emticicia sp. C21]
MTKKRVSEKQKQPLPHEEVGVGKNELLIVGIGASAGGIVALQEFFRHVPANSGIAYVVILHLSPDHDSKLANILQSVAAIPVSQVTEKVKVEANKAYIVPPNQHLIMQDGFIAVSPNTNFEDRRAPVDIFFRSLADSHGARAVCVVLSGTGANGSMGLKRIKERGGVAFVQNPREAEFNEMPRNAIATELVDEVLSVAAIPERIIVYRRSLSTTHIPLEAEARGESQQLALREIFAHLRLRTGHDFTNYKRPTLLRRIERRINICNFADLPSYAAFLKDSPDETTALLKDLLISVTNFFRDRRPFDILEQEIIPRITANKNSEKQVRIWVAGCATGEEAYSLAILCAEKVMGVIDAPKIQIFATDIDQTAINIAREGLYTINDAADISPERLRRFFNKEGDQYRIRREIRETVLFAIHNFIKDPPFSHLDLVSCRNVLIYLNHVAQERTMETFHFALRPGGFLFLGTSESVDGASDLFASFNRDAHLYQSREVNVRSYPVPETVPSFSIGQTIVPTTQHEKKVLERITFSDLHHRLLEEYAPPSLIVNEEYEIVHLSGSVGKYLQISGGEITQNLLKLLKEELRLEIRSALYQAVQRKQAVEARGLKVKIDAHIEIVNVHIRPVLRQEDTARGFILVLFESKPINQDDTDKEVLVSPNENISRHLEEQLVRIKGELRNAIEQHEFQQEELKASNEELQAMNEELRSSAEELETSKEELQSINEELRTVNQELKVKIEESTLSANNLQNLIDSADVGTLFLDRSFRVSLFTPTARNIFNLIPSDYGRPLTDITNKLNDDNLLHDAEIVMRKLKVIEREVTTKEGMTYSMRMLPYRTTEDQINGVVITFFDITTRKKAEEKSHINEERMRRQKEVFQAAIDGKTLADALNIIARLVAEETGARTAFYMVDQQMIYLQPIWGAGNMPEDYLKEIDNTVIGEDLFVCGLAAPNGRPVLISNVFEDPLWKPWISLAEKSNFRGCWSFPIKTFENKAVGTFAMYFTEAHEATPNDRSLAEVVTQTAAVIIANFANIKERQEAEEALRKSDERYRLKLEQEVQERTLALKKSQEELSEKNIQLNYTISKLESFNYLASHDLREPLRKIQTYVKLLNKAKDDNKKLELFLKSIGESTERMTQLIDDLLSFSRLSRPDEDFELVDLNQILNNVKADYEMLINDKQAVILNDTLPVIHAIPFQMHQLFANLISNALKFNEGKPEVKITTSSVYGDSIKEDFELKPETTYAEIVFSDNGIGFDNEYNTKIFELFQRLHGKSEYSGTGIGLGIVEKIVNNHHGFIKADGEVGKGARFTIWLPLS